MKNSEMIGPLMLAVGPAGEPDYARDWLNPNVVLVGGKHALKPIQVGGRFFTLNQLRKANRESIRLGFSRNLNFPKDVDRSLRFPVVEAWHHTSGEGFTNIRMRIVFAKDREGTGISTTTILDVTPEVWNSLKRSERIAA